MSEAKRLSEALHDMPLDMYVVIRREKCEEDGELMLTACLYKIDAETFEDDPAATVDPKADNVLAGVSSTRASVRDVGMLADLVAYRRGDKR